MDRQTSMPDILGSMRSSSTRSGSTSSNSCRASLPSRATDDLEALVAQPDDQGVDEGLLVLGQQDAPWSASWSVSVLAAVGHEQVFGLEREHQGEGRSLALPRLHVDPALVVAGHVADDGEPEPVPPVSRLRPWSTR